VSETIDGGAANAFAYDGAADSPGAAQRHFSARVGISRHGPWVHDAHSRAKPSPASRAAPGVADGPHHTLAHHHQLGPDKPFFGHKLVTN
jgi:hypothetical protein